MALGDTLKSAGKGKLVMMLVMTIASIALFSWLAVRLSEANMVPLYSNLSLEDSSRLIAELEKSNTPYQLVANGTQIMVPSDRVLRMRMTMAQQGLPSGGSVVGYEIFDREEVFGSSNFVMNINMMRALEGELARTIGAITNVDTARVHLVMPKRELFSRDKAKPSASVTIKMRGGHSLDRGEVTSITHLVASAVPGLDASKVTVVDSHGRLLARGDGSDSLSASASTVLEYRIAYETRIQQVVEDLVEKVVGAGKVRAQVTADINFDRVVTNSEKFDPDGQVARSSQSNSESEKAKETSPKDSVSAANNLPGAAAEGGAGAGSNRDADHSSETVNYEISKTVQNHVKEGGTINKVSIAVLVDGNYTSDDEGKQTYSPRTEEEMKQIKSLINSAIGYDEKRGDKIEVVNMQFNQDMNALEEESFLSRFKIEMQSIVQTLIIGVVAILAILLVLRPAIMQLIKQAQFPSDRVAGELAAIEGSAGANAQRLPSAGGAGGGGGAAVLQQQEPELLIDVANIKGGMKSSSMKKISEIVDKYPEESMGVLRQWIARNA